MIMHDPVTPASALAERWDELSVRMLDIPLS
jgi:hypothetical protein